MTAFEQQQLLDHEIPEDALAADIANIGGLYKVGKMLRPELEKKAARDWLLNCLNPKHKQNLTLAQMDLVKGWARQVGSTYFSEYWATTNKMSKPVKIEPEDEKAKLQREFVSCFKRMEGMAEEALKKGFFN